MQVIHTPVNAIIRIIYYIYPADEQLVLIEWHESDRERGRRSSPTLHSRHPIRSPIFRPKTQKQLDPSIRDT